MRKIVLYSVFFFVTFPLFSQETAKAKTDSLSKEKSYSVIVADQSLRMFTMRQFNQNYLSAYRYMSDVGRNCLGNNKNIILQVVFSLVTLPLTHEEGHRSILTSFGIGAISQPIFNLKGAAYVNGVTDQTLMAIRQKELPSYIRLHTGGLESDYMLLKSMDDLVAFDNEEEGLIRADYFMRKLSSVLYYAISPFEKLNIKLKEEPNELDRDIVGHDVYGAVKNLYRPNEPFFRYTNYLDLTSSEKRFINRAALRSLLNFVTPTLIKPLRLVDNNQTQISVGFGYTMSPFGDFIDENFWIKYHQYYKISGYLRQFENKHTWFMAGGIRLTDYQLLPRLSTTLAIHLWSQPKGLDFNTNESQFGGAAEAMFKYPILTTPKSSFSLDAGCSYKTFGFLPEEMYLKENLGLRVGFTMNFKSH